MGNTYFKHRSVHKYTTVGKGRGGIEIKSMIDIMLVKRDMLRYVQDVREMRGMGCGLSDHYDVLCKVRLVKVWIKRREVMVAARRIMHDRSAWQRFVRGDAWAVAQGMNP